MHPSALSNALRFREAYCGGRHALQMVEVGAQDVNGSLRAAFAPLGTYVGVDFVRAEGVDVVLDDPYQLPFADASVDVVLCSSVLEHSQFFWLLFLEMLRILKPAGLLYLNAPSNGSFHRYPVDCWRFYPDSGDALVAWAQRSGYGPRLLETYVSDQERAEWNDCVSIFVKDAALADCYPTRVLDSLVGYRNGRMHGRDGFLAFNSRTEDQERAAGAPDSASAVSDAPASEMRSGGGEGDGLIRHWTLESPAALAGGDEAALVGGWVLLSRHAAAVRLVLRSGHATGAWPLNVERPDVVAAHPEPDASGRAPPLRCGFKRRFKATERLQVGFEVDGSIHWIAEINRSEQGARTPA